MVARANRAIVGANAFAHERGIHQDGIIKDASTYEIMTPESAGQRATNLVLGKHSDHAAFQQKLDALGYSLSDNPCGDMVIGSSALSGCTCQCAGSGNAYGTFPVTAWPISWSRE